MTLEVVWEPLAVSLATRFLTDDAGGLGDLVEAVDALAEEPRPAQASPLGTSGLYRLRVGRYRAVDEVDEASRMIKIGHISRRA